ncbi:MAG: VCBS repeat-containing protein [Verrucomicrobia bacterium]|nr:VCBS repeat-containing protein [Verrucomicrobiota bacterium]
MRTDATRNSNVFLAGMCLVALLALISLSVAEATTNTVPQIQAIYGGRITAINSIELTDQPNVSRVFAATESANSIFYGDVDHALAMPYATNNFRFTVVPDFNAQANFGQVGGIAGHPASGRLFIVDDAGLLSCDPTTAGTRITNIIGQVTQPPPPAPPVPSGPCFISIFIQDSTLLAIGNMGDSNLLYFGAIDTGGNFTKSDSPITIGGSGVNARALLVHPTNQCVYIYDCDSTNGLIKSTAAFNALSGATFSSVNVTNVISSWTGTKRFGIAPDGRLFIAGNNSGGNKACIYSDNDGKSWTTVDTGAGGTTGGNVECAGDTNNYHVYFGSMVSTNKGITGSWQGIAQFGTRETNPNDGVVVADAINSLTVYVTTDQGIGASTNGGHDLFEIDYGLEAVQIQDLDMNAAKTLAWTASKSGLRKGTGTPMALQWTENGIFPNFDGSPFYSIAIDKTDASGNTVYAGNARLYKTTDGGTNWPAPIWNIDVNTNGFQSGGYFSSLKASGQTVVAGFYDQGTTRGGLLISSDSGTNWAQAMTEVDVNDVLLMSDGTLLVAAAYDSATGVGGVYQVAATAVIRELTNAVGIRNLAEDSSGGVYASGQDSSYALKVYYRAASGATWTEVTTTGLPPELQAVNGRGPVITVGKDNNTNDLPIMAVSVSLYYLAHGGSAWQTSSSLTYPAGSQINVLYWDELMVGTSEGLYGQVLNAESNASVENDYDGDGKSDLAVYSAGYWSIYSLVNGLILINGGVWGGSDSITVPGDYDGDGKADLAVYSAGYWSIYSLVNGLILINGGAWGDADSIPVPGDYDGDGKADLAVYRAGYWSIYSLANGLILINGGAWGDADSIPVPGDYDGDGKSDLAVYNAGYWSIYSLANGLILINGGAWGDADSIPVSGDYDGDGKSDLAVYNAGYWSIYSIANGIVLNNGGAWGGADWTPVR